VLERTITGVVFIAVLIGCILLGPYTFCGLFLLITLIGLNEFYSLSAKTGHQPAKVLGLLLGLLLFTGICSTFLPALSIIAYYPLALLFPLLFLVPIIELFRKKENPFANIALTYLGVFYVALPLTLLCMLSHIKNRFEGISTHPYSSHILLGFFFILWASDTGAYLAGKAFGRHKLFERISPKKTWEGTIGGAVLSLAVAWIVSRYFAIIGLSAWLVVSLIIVVFGTFGDLTESLLKRSADSKDSGSLLPGHGGILDRFDSLLLSVPFVFLYLAFTNSF